jgi:arginyl-tRNA synthetase
MSAVTDLRGAVADAVAALAGGATPKSAPTLERPKQADHGDYATNAAMLLAPLLRAKPRDVAEQLRAELTERLGATLERAEVAGPGFLNLFLADTWHVAALGGMLEAGERFGGDAAATRQRINIEFVSVNPTGPLHVGHSRNAAYGDALTRLLEFHGHDVHREYYVNDAGTQVEIFARSIQARARGEEVPEGGYRGEYVVGIAERIPGAADLPLEEIVQRGVQLMVDDIRTTLQRFHVGFDTWFSEESLHVGSPSKVEHAFDVLREQGRVYESDGALWVRTTEFGDDKDRVIVRSTGEHTYFASDIAYHQDKRERGFDVLIDVWGADHHGYVPRMHAAYEALGGDPDTLELIIMQLVHLVGAGKLSKRAGTIVTLDELIDDIGADAARWFLLQRSHDTTMELDLDLARSQSSENPVYYVQYAHARIASILRRTSVEPRAELPDGYALHASERVLVKRLLQFPTEVAEAAERRHPHRIAAYGLALAQDFTAFYRDCQIVGSDVEPLRLALAVAAQRTIARSLDLLGIDAPQSMHREEDQNE